ncbi:MAG: NAD(P)-dependent oxidoreductase [Candidatus Micrarchaeia archaeon]
MVTIAFFELEEWEKKYISRKLRGQPLVFIEGHMEEGNLSKAADAEVVSIFIYSKVGEKELSMLPKLKAIATRSTGFDHIDLKACAARGVSVFNVPAYGSETVAEHTMALALALSKKLVPSVENTRRGDFSLDGLRTFDLQGKYIGIIGLGKIGSHVAKMARAFGMKVLAYSPHTDPEFARKKHCRLVQLDELLAKSDIISLHTPLTPQTRHMINSDSISKMKKGAILINTARGGLVDARALVEGLDSGRLAAVGLDVLEEECNIKEERQILSPQFAGECDLKTVLANHMLLNKPNVLITPHNAFNSTEALQKILDTTLENVKGYLSGNPVNKVE